MLVRDVRPKRQLAGPPRVRPNVEERVVEAALALAVKGGFDAVRQREVAERAGVALGTLYKRFPTKDELLVGVLEVESRRLAKRLDREPPKGATPVERVANYFGLATHYFVRKPKLGQAILRAVTSGEHVTQRMMAYHAAQMRHVVGALQGPSTLGVAPPDHFLTDEQAIMAATILLQVWFAALVGWSGGLFEADGVVQQVESAARLILLGLLREAANDATRMR